MRVVLREAAHPEKPVKGAGKLMTMNDAQFPYPQGQIPVRMHLSLINQHAAGAVHGLDGKVFPIDDGGVHVVL